MYDVKSLNADDFINDEEILATLEYAEQNKHNRELIEQILEKARPKKTGRGVECAGLTHREASVLLACDIPEMTEKMYELAKEIKGLGEKAKVTIRNVRRDTMEKYKTMKKNSEITEDDLKDCEKKVQDLTDKMCADVDKMVVDKEKEIMTV